MAAGSPDATLISWLATSMSPASPRRGLPFLFYWSKPMTVPREFSKLLTGVLMFGAFTLAIVITAYQILSPQDSIFLWVQDVWETSPLLIFAMGLLMFPGKRWIDGYSQDKEFAHPLLYLFSFIGLFVGFNWLA
jgi:hypothetical protein